VIVDNLDIVSVAIAPAKADTPLIVDPDTPLPGSIADQLFQSVRRRYPQILEARRCFQHSKFSERNPLNVRRETTRPLQVEELLGLTVSPTADHLAR